MAGVLLLQYATAQAPESVMLADNVPAEVPAERPEFVLVPDSELASVPFVNASSLPKSASGTQFRPCARVVPASDGVFMRSHGNPANMLLLLQAETSIQALAS